MDPLTVADVRAAFEKVAHAPMRPPVLRFVHPDDERHLRRHGGGRSDCQRCHRIWATAALR